MDTGSSSAVDSHSCTEAKQIQTWSSGQIAELRDGADARHSGHSR